MPIPNVKSGFAFIEYEDGRDADDAVYDLDGKPFMGERWENNPVNPTYTTIIFKKDSSYHLKLLLGNETEYAVVQFPAFVYLEARTANIDFGSECTCGSAGSAYPTFSVTPPFLVPSFIAWNRGATIPLFPGSCQKAKNPALDLDPGMES